MAGLNRTQLENEVAQTISGGHKEAKEAVAVIVETIQRSLIAGERVHITGLGSLNSQQVPSRMVRNPATGKRVRAKKTRGLQAQRSAQGTHRGSQEAQAEEVRLLRFLDSSSVPPGLHSVSGVIIWRDSCIFK